MKKKNVKSSYKRSDKSLGIITKQIINILKTNDYYKVSDLIEITCKRRCYDVILVLEACGKLERVSKGIVRWLPELPKFPEFPEFDDEIIEEFFS